jgi:hypothetical protein
MSLRSVPSYVTKYFWGDNIDQLDVEKSKKYIIQTLLEQGNKKAVSWLFATFDAKTIRNLLPEIKLSKKSAHFWQIYLSR